MLGGKDYFPDGMWQGTTSPADRLINFPYNHRDADIQTTTGKTSSSTNPLVQQPILYKPTVCNIAQTK